MPLTRHLYREDEVVAALVLCVQRRRTTEALFWALELLDSGLANQLETALQVACGPAADSLFAGDELDAAAVLAFVAGGERGLAAAQPAFAEWQAATGRRQRRAFSVPVDCLYWITERGRILSVYDSNEAEILGSLERPGALWGSEYWDETAEAYGGWEAVRDDPAAREAFYAENFPDDIPDEWSKKERAKSHGSGVLQRGTPATAEGWARRWRPDAALAERAAALAPRTDSS